LTPNQSGVRRYWKVSVAVCCDLADPADCESLSLAG
jgi:hypothetical protein